MDQVSGVDRGPVRPLNPVVRAAIAMHRRPGSYVVLLGAGISKPTGIKSAWEILGDLIGEVAVAENAVPDDPMNWWQEHRGVEANYSDVLEAVASTQEERRAVLAKFFEPTPSDLEEGNKQPSEAHREIARLVARGFIRVIVTLNFDHLMERALRDESIEPVVVSGAAQAEAMEPLHAQRCIVVHLHGDYLSPDLLNTSGELASYDESLERLIRQIADEYGLIIVGWSAEWDTRLVELLTSHDEPRFTTWWIAPGELNATQLKLESRRRVEMIALPADEALSKLATAVDAVVEDAKRDQPLDVAVGVATMKRELRTNGLAMRSHDLIRKSLGGVGESSVIRPDDYHDRGVTEVVRERTEAVLSELGAAAAYVATLAYWGDDRTDRWWFDDLERLSWRPHAGGLTSLINLARSPSVVLCYSAGVAAVAAERWDLVLRLLTEPSVEDDIGSKRSPLVATLTPGSCGLAGGSKRLCRFVAGVVHRYVGLGVGLTIDAWERFEYLCALKAMDGEWLPWEPRMRVAQLGNSGWLAMPAMWLDDHGDVLQSFLGAPGWFDGVETTRRRTAFASAFSKQAKNADYGLLPPGQAGFLPSGPHYPGSFDDRPDIDV